MAWAMLTKLRKALVERAGEIDAERNPSAPGESPIKGGGLTCEQLESVDAEVFEEFPDANSARDAGRDDSPEAWRKGRSHEPVSYTHLTLPTIYSV